MDKENLAHNRELTEEALNHILRAMLLLAESEECLLYSTTLFPVVIEGSKKKILEIADEASVFFVGIKSDKIKLHIDNQFLNKAVVDILIPHIDRGEVLMKISNIKRILKSEVENTSDGETIINLYITADITLY